MQKPAGDLFKILEPNHHRTVLSDMWTKILLSSYDLVYLSYFIHCKLYLTLFLLCRKPDPKLM